LDIKDALAGDAQAYARLVKKYEKQVTRLMWRFTRQPALCEELVQEVFIQGYFGLKGYRGKGPFINWLKKIGTRVGYRFWKEGAKRKSDVPLPDYDLVGQVSVDAMDASDAADILHRLLERLPVPDRLVLTLMYLEDCGTKEIAQQMGCTRAMVKMRAMRARKKLRDIAEKENILEKLQWTD
jgi:RNA polymerase sigma-70 factor (ECF subfamily)